jgi:hypothetical protein
MVHGQLATAHFELALAGIERGELDDAAAHVTKALALKPPEPMRVELLAARSRIAAARGTPEPARPPRAERDPARSSVLWGAAPRLDEAAARSRFAARLAHAVHDLDLLALFDGETRAIERGRWADLVIDDAANIVIDGDFVVDGVLERRGDAGSLIVLGELHAGHIVTTEDGGIVAAGGLDVRGVLVGEGERWPTHVLGDATVGTLIGLRNHEFFFHRGRAIARELHDEVNGIAGIERFLVDAGAIDEGVDWRADAVARGLRALTPP